MPHLSLTPPLFTILSALVEERIGVSYTASDKEIFESKVSARASDAGFESMLDYYYYLRYDDPDGREFQALSEALLVHETFFFRELDSLRVVLDQFIAPRVAAGARPRIWCCACATGEEPLTIAMLLAQAGVLGKVELVATDLSDAALARAKSGVFGPRALRQSPDQALVARYLVREEGSLRVSSTLLSAVDFRRVNLICAEEVSALGRFDVIVCRNVLIYFRDERAKGVLRTLCDALLPDGALLVGVSESLLRFGGALRCEEHKGVFLYCKRGAR